MEEKRKKRRSKKRKKIPPPKVSTVRAAAQAGLISILIAYVLYGEALYAYRVRTVRWGLAVRSCLDSISHRFCCRITSSHALQRVVAAASPARDVCRTLCTHSSRAARFRFSPSSLSRSSVHVRYPLGPHWGITATQTCPTSGITGVRGGSTWGITAPPGASLGRLRGVPRGGRARGAYIYDSEAPFVGTVGAAR